MPFSALYTDVLALVLRYAGAPAEFASVNRACLTATLAVPPYAQTRALTKRQLTALCRSRFRVLYADVHVRGRADLVAKRLPHATALRYAGGYSATGVRFGARLETLELYSCRAEFLRALLPALPTRLRELRVDTIDLEDVCMRPLELLENLRVLHIDVVDRAAFNAANMDALRRLSRLRVMRSTTVFTGTFLRALFAPGHALQHLRLDTVFRWMSDDVHAALELVPTELRVSVGFQQSFGFLPRLRALTDLDMCSQSRNDLDSAVAVVASCTYLRTLRLHNTIIVDTCVPLFVASHFGDALRGLSFLRALHIEDYQSPRDLAFLRGLSLHHLELISNGGVPASELARVVALTTLETVNLHNVFEHIDAELARAFHLPSRALPRLTSATLRN